jgi:hypothetical protein
MGTRGLIGYYKKGVTKACYNHWDSYPTGLGAKTKNYITNSTLAGLNQDFEGIRLINEDDEITPEDVIRYMPIWYGNVEEISAEGWYEVMHEKQGDFYAYAESGLMIDNIEFMKDSLFCEWAYIINLSDNTLEVYRGFQQKKPKKNRYAMTKDEVARVKLEKGWDVVEANGKRRHVNNQYYNCDLIANIPFEMVHGFDMGIFEDLINRSEETTDKTCGNILLDEDFSQDGMRGNGIPLTMRVCGICDGKEFNTDS